MKRFEYCYVQYIQGSTEPNTGFASFAFRDDVKHITGTKEIDVLCKMGEDGWEMAGLDNTVRQGIRIYFKREI